MNNERRSIAAFQSARHDQWNAKRIAYNKALDFQKLCRDLDAKYDLSKLEELVNASEYVSKLHHTNVHFGLPRLAEALRSITRESKPQP